MPGDLKRGGRSARARIPRGPRLREGHQESPYTPTSREPPQPFGKQSGGLSQGSGIG